MTATRAAIGLAIGSLGFGASAAQPPALKDVLRRMDAYVATFEQRMSRVVATERYRQQLEVRPAGIVADAVRKGRPAPTAPAPITEARTLRSDYALLRSGNGDWVGFRDTFEVDGMPVRDHDDRLQRLLMDGALTQAAAIASESARFNLGTDFVPRTVNVPTLALRLLRESERWRFSVRKSGEDTIGDAHVWRIEFRERERPTIVRRANGADQRSRAQVWVSPDTGEIWRTMLAWEETPSTVTVSYGHVDGIDVLVPVTMSERYDPGGAVVTGEAVYSDFRQFQTGARLVSPLP